MPVLPVPDPAPGAVVRLDGELVRVLLDHPQRRNAMDLETMRAIADALVSHAEHGRAVLVSASGQHFCAGADIRNADRSRDEARRTGSVHRQVAANPHRLLRVMWELELPVVAAVRGTAAGFGAMLALAADHVVAGPSARFSTPYVDRGFSADSGSSWLLPRLVGLARAKQMLLGRRVVDGEEAAAWGLVAECVPDDEVDDTAEDVARGYAAGPTTAYGLTRQLLHRHLETDLAAALRGEEMAVELAVRSPDFREGIAAFREGRDARWSGR